MTKNAVPTTQCTQTNNVVKYRRPSGSIRLRVQSLTRKTPSAVPSNCDTRLQFSECNIFSPERPRKSEGMEIPDPAIESHLPYHSRRRTGDGKCHGCATAVSLQFHFGQSINTEATGATHDLL